MSTYSPVPSTDAGKVREESNLLGSLDAHEIEKILKEHYIELESYSKENLADFRKAIESGHWSWRMLGTASAGLTLLLGAGGLLQAALNKNLYDSLINGFVVFFALVGLCLELKEKIFSTQRLEVLKKEAHFLFRPYGRAMFFVFAGLFTASQPGQAFQYVGFTSVIVGVTIYYATSNAAKALTSLRVAAMDEKVLRKKFEEVDANQSGSLDSSELAVLCRSLGSNLNVNELEAALFILDKNGDGMVSFDEFLVWWKSKSDSG